MAAPTWPHVHVHVVQVSHIGIEPAAGAVIQAGGVQGLGVHGHALRLHSRQWGQSLETRPRRQEQALPL